MKVAVLDSGIDGEHPDLVGKVAAERNFTGVTVERGKRTHGTHIASTIAGNSEKYRSVAPDAQLLDAQICTGASVVAATPRQSWPCSGRPSRVRRSST